MIIMSLWYPEADAAATNDYKLSDTYSMCVAGLRTVHQALPPVTHRISKCGQEPESVEFFGLRIYISMVC